MSAMSSSSLFKNYKAVRENMFSASKETMSPISTPFTISSVKVRGLVRFFTFIPKIVYFVELIPFLLYFLVMSG